MFGGGGKKINISSELYEKIKLASELAMCATPEEYIVQILQEKADEVLIKAGKGDLSQDEVDDITKKLQGLGYLD